MKSLSNSYIENINTFLKGKKQEKFLKSVITINESLSQNTWVKRGTVTGNSGFYQGLIKTPFSLRYDGYEVGTELWHEMNKFERCINYGEYSEGIDIQKCYNLLKDARNKDETKYKLKASFEIVESWILLCKEKKEAYEYLASSKPLPIFEKLTLSPRVKKTLNEMNLDIDLATITYPEVERKEKIIEKDNKKIKEVFYKIIWPEGIKHNQSRFSDKVCNCHACGKYIPSGTFVPLYAKDRKSNKLVSLLLGRDCAYNVFKVKDVGINLDE